MLESETTMIVLHGAYLEDLFYLWGEEPPEEKEGRRSKSAEPRRLPYDAGPADLSSAVTTLLAEAEGLPGKTVNLTAWILTGAKDTPAPSSELIAGRPEGDCQIAPWTITAMPLPPGAMLELLEDCIGRDVLAPGIIIGPDLGFWASALRFAGALAARQQFLPGVAEKDGVFRARWEPVFTGADAGRAALLAKAMPGACRALSHSADAPPAAPASVVLEEFLTGALDELVGWSASSGSAGDPYRESRPRRDFDSLHEQWIYALRSHNPTLRGDPTELQALVRQVQEWRRPIAVTASAPFRLCFRLEEPPSDPDDADDRPQAAAADWYLRYLLQDVADPSLLVPADLAWQANGKSKGKSKAKEQGSSLLSRASFNPREYMLSALGQASKMDAGIEASLRHPAPVGYAMDTTAAFEFLTQKAWLLEASGYRVMLPAWWTRKGTKLRLTARASVKSPKLKNRAGLSMDTIVAFDWQVALGGEPLTAAELETLANHKAPLVRVRGQWVQVDAEEIQAALDFWKKHQTQSQATVGDVVRMALGAGQAPGGLQVDGVSATGWMADFLDRLKTGAGMEDLSPPTGLRADLRPYQKRGYSWLSFLRQWGLGACLADDMGLGKTVQVLALLQRERESGGKRPVLVVCPTSVLGNWQKEAERFAPGLPVLIHHGLGREKGSAFEKAVSKYAIVLTSFALLHRDVEALKRVDWAGLVVDEAQNIKNPETKAAKAARSLPGEFRVALTGTPVENHVGDLWSVMEFLNPGFLGSQAEFKRRFFIPIQAERDPEASERLKKLTGPFLLRRLKTDRAIIQDLPEKMEMKVFCNLTREQASLYEAVVKDAEESIADSEGIQRRGLVLATLMKLKQVCNHPAQFLGDNSSIPGRSGKLARLTEMLEEALSTGDSVLIFSQFTVMGEMLRKHLEGTFGREVLFLHGGVPKARRDLMVERFQSENGPRLFILSLKAGGTGLNLTRASHVFHFDRWWNPAVENQATDRAFRIGQKKNVQVHKFLCAGTMEERIDEMIESKRAIAANVVGAGEGWLSELSTEELRDLFRLRQNAVGD